MPYVSQEQDLFRWRGTLQQIMIEQTDENLTKIEQSKKGLEEKLAYEKEKFAEYNKGLEEKEALFSACSKEHNAIQKELERTDAEFKEFERKDIKYREDLKHSKQQLKKVTEKHAKDEAKLEAAAAQEEALTAEVHPLWSPRF
eukprot:1196083-Prorocentrum_minimum.AAC.8